MQDLTHIRVTWCGSASSDVRITQRDGGMVMNGGMSVSSAPLRCVAAHGIAQRRGAAPLVVAMLVAAVILGACAAARVSPAPPK